MCAPEPVTEPSPHPVKSSPSHLKFPCNHFVPFTFRSSVWSLSCSSINIFFFYQSIVRAICLAYLILHLLPFNYMVKNTCYEASPKLLFPFCHFPLLRPHIPLWNLFSNTLILFPFLYVTYRVSNPWQTVENINVPYFNLQTFRWEREDTEFKNK